MFEITKSIQKVIDSSAEKLPILYHESETEIVKVHGSNLVNQGITQLKTGERISYDEFYSIERPKKINHRHLLRKVYEMEGMPGVVEYCRICRKLVIDAKSTTIHKQ